MITTALSHAPVEQDSSLRDIEEVLCNNLRSGWFLTIEHTAQMAPHYTAWKRWGNSFASALEPRTVINAIVRCRASHPQHIIRLRAQQFQPQTSFVIWV